MAVKKKRARIYRPRHRETVLVAHPPEDPVSIEELRVAVLECITQRFGHRFLDLRTARRALQDVAFELGMAHLKAIATK